MIQKLPANQMSALNSVAYQLKNSRPIFYAKFEVFSSSVDYSIVIAVSLTLDNKTLQQIQHIVMCARIDKFFRQTNETNRKEGNPCSKLHRWTYAHRIESSSNTKNVSKDDVSIVRFWFNLMYKRYCRYRFAYISIQNSKTLGSPWFSVEKPYCSPFVWQ